MMKKVLLALALMAWQAMASAADGTNTKYAIGGGYGFDYGGVLSLHGDIDISAQTRNPIKVRIGWDHYKQDLGVPGFAYTWTYDVYYGGAYYDFNQQLGRGSPFHPFLGLGYGFGRASCSGWGCGGWASPTVGGLYWIGGVQYDLNRSVNLEANFNGWGGLTLGANYKF